MTPGEFRSKAVDSLALASEYPILSPARTNLLLQANVYATLGGPIPDPDVIQVRAWGEEEPVATIPAPPAPTEARPRARAKKTTASSKEGSK